MQDKELLHKLYWEDKKSLREIGEMYGVSAARVYKWCKRLGVETRDWTTKGLKFPDRKLSKEHKEKLRKWHTGRPLAPEHRKKVTEALLDIVKKRTPLVGTIRKSHGVYLKIKTAPGVWKYLHRHIVEQKIGRVLKKEEEVHHINFDSSDNNIDNLIVLSRKDHLLLHSQLEYIMKDLFKNGLVCFEKGKYKIKSS